jgi:hypothetical protein
VTRYFIGLPGFLNRLPLLPPEGADASDYAKQVELELGAGRRTAVRVTLSGRQVDLQVNPAALMWWYLANEPERSSDELDAQWPAPAS